MDYSDDFTATLLYQVDSVTIQSHIGTIFVMIFLGLLFVFYSLYLSRIKFQRLLKEQRIIAKQTQAIKTDINLAI